MSSKFICGFNRDRDSYQVPLALAEDTLLECFVTDYYFGHGIRIPQLEHRIIEGLDSNLTRNTYVAIVLQWAWLASSRVGLRFDFPEFRVDSMISSHIEQVAKKSNADLLLYSSFASSFSRDWAKDRRKILFQFHPFPSYSKPLFAQDQHVLVDRFQQVAEVKDAERQMRRHGLEVEHSDLILCASSVTKRSLTSFGYPASQIKVIPYGSPKVATQERTNISKKIRFLFVGTGVQRKGLHHLLDAWKKFPYRNESELHVVSRNIDPVMLELASDDVQIIHGLPSRELEQAMIDADVFVLPSLLEGFGLVLTEALSRGCHLVASHETGLPDLNLSSNLATLVESPVNAEHVGVALQQAYERVVAIGCESVMQEAKEAASAYTWDDFRRGVRSAIKA